MGSGRVARIVAAGVVVQAAALAGALAVTDRLAAGRAGAPVGAISDRERALILGTAPPSTVRVTGRGCTATVTGTGFVVEGRVVTNAHVAAGAGALDLRPERTGNRSAGGLAGRVAVAVADPGRDLAVSRPLDPAPAGLALAPGQVPAGERVLVLGRGEGPLRWLEGTVQVVEPGWPFGIDGPVALLDRAVGEGWSGGPVLDHRGRVVGVVKGVDRATGLTVVVPAEAVAAAVAGAAAAEAGTDSTDGPAGCP